MKKDWKVKSFDEILAVLTNGLNSKQNKDFLGEKITRIETIAFEKVDFSRVGYSIISEKQKKKHKLQRGDILFSHINSPPHVGKTAIYNDDKNIYHGINLLLMRVNNQVDPFFFEKYLKKLYYSGYWKVNCKKSINQASVNQQDIKKLRISFPSIQEQKRIVEKLDTCMEQIDKAIQNVEQNIQNGEELFQSYLNEIFCQKGDNWETKKLIDVFDINPKKNTNLAEKSLATYAPMKDLGFYYSKTLFTQEKSIDKIQKGLKNFIENDLLLAKVTPCFENGKLGIARNLTNGVGFGSTEYIVFRQKNKVSTDYLFLFLSQDSFRLHGKRNMTGTSGLKRVPLNFVKNYSISYPINNEEQNRIINLANEFKAGINTLNSNNLVKLNALKELKQSILEKAFNGEL